MKLEKIIIAGFAGLSATAFAGSVETAPAPAPVQESYLSGWFAAASFGQIYDVGSNLDNAFNVSQDLGDRRRRERGWRWTCRRVCTPGGFGPVSNRCRLQCGQNLQVGLSRQGWTSF